MNTKTDVHTALTAHMYYLTIQNSQWQSPKSQTHSFRVMNVFNCPVHSEGHRSPRGLAAARGIEGQQICMITKTISYHHLKTLHNCRKRLAVQSWTTSLKYRYITSHSESKAAESHAQTETISHQSWFHPHPPKHRGGYAGEAGG